MRGRVLVVIALLGVGLAPILPTVHAAGNLVQLTQPVPPTINVGYVTPNFSDAEEITHLSATLQNQGDQPVTINSGIRSTALNGFVFADLYSVNPSTVAPNEQTTVTFQVTVRSNNGLTNGQPLLTPGLSTDAGTFQVNIQVGVRDWRRPQPDVTSPLTFAHTMPCPRPTATTPFTFNLPIRNVGDHALSVGSISFSNFPYPIESLSGFGSFTVPALGQVERSYRVQLPPTVSQGTLNGNILVSTSGGSASALMQLALTLPVQLDLPDNAVAHEFGEQELTVPSAKPFQLPLVEACGYRSVRVELEAPPSAPSYAVVTPTVVDVPAGERRSIEVGVRFNATHASLLLRPQSFELRFSTTLGATKTYVFRATPVFIDFRQAEQSLENLGASAQSAAGRAAALRMHALLVNRTEVNRPSSQADLDDASRIVTLAEPIALTIQRIDLMLGWNQANETQRTVQDLLAITAGFEDLEAVCADVTSAPDRAECQAVLSILRDELRRFAEQARDQFTTITRAGGNELERARAHTGLSLSLAALDQSQEAERLAAQARGHFANFTEDLSAAQRLLKRIAAREDAADPAIFVRGQGRYAAWHPLSLPLFSGYVAATDRDYAEAAALLAHAGDDVRLAEVRTDQAAFHREVDASRTVNLVIMGAYVALAAAIALYSLRAVWGWRSAERAARLGDVLLPELAAGRR